MCMTIYLLADRKLPAPTSEAAYPGLMLYPVDADGQSEFLAGIRSIALAAFVYDVRPDGYCGCYFYHDTPEMFADQMARRQAEPGVEYANTPEQAEAMWRGQTSAVKSFGRYLSDHADAALAVYVVWEGCAGRKAPTRAVVSPSYFDAPGFASLPEDLLLAIIPGSAGGEDWPWNPTAPRTHDWPGYARECGASDLGACGGRAPAER
jgi:hypothetical protein